ncbi:MAG: precorrin-6A reductase [Lachnospiraceae bacterium]|nr:precorrin-6A reductase [Lachnospiraceae bacterium]
MTKLCIFAGTSEGKQLAEALAGRGVQMTVCVATEYGEISFGQLPDCTVLAGRMPRDEIEAMLRKEAFAAVVDATHPYAEHITESIRSAAEAAGTAYIRLLRESTASEEDGAFVSDTPECIEVLKKTEGNILLTTGSKTLPLYCEDPALKERIYARVLPLEDSLRTCTECGLTADRILAVRGPFSRDMNAAMLRMVKAEWMVTKDTGSAGGYEDKIAAAKECGAKAVIIGRPVEKEEGYSLAETVSLLEEKLKLAPKRKKVVMVGIGMGTEGTLTAEGKKAIETADVLLGAQRMLEGVKSARSRTFSAIAAKDIADAIERENGPFFAVLYSGDTGFYSGAKSLAGVLKERGVEADVTILPGIGSLSYFCAKLGRTWQDVKAISLHGRETDLVRYVKENPAVFTLLGGQTGAQDALNRLKEAGLGCLNAYVGQKLGYDDEAIVSGTVEELAVGAYDPLSVLLVENPAWKSYPVTHGIADDAFTRADVPMTKQEIRSVTLSKLRLTKGAVVWDIGSGSGSVSVECALQASEGHVYAIEKEKDAVELTRANMEKFGVCNMTVVEGEAPGALADLPAPTHAFIGGSTGNLKEILAVLLEKNPHVRIVANAVTMETVAELSEAAKEFAWSDICCVNVSRGRKMGRYHLMTAQNPVYIVTMQN